MPKMPQFQMHNPTMPSSKARSWSSLMTSSSCSTPSTSTSLMCSLLRKNSSTIMKENLILTILQKLIWRSFRKGLLIWICCWNWSSEGSSSITRRNGGRSWMATNQSSSTPSLSGWSRKPSKNLKKVQLMMRMKVRFWTTKSRTMTERFWTTSSRTFKNMTVIILW